MSSKVRSGIQRLLDCGNLKKENLVAIPRASGHVSLSSKGRGNCLRAPVPHQARRGMGRPCLALWGKEGAVLSSRRAEDERRRPTKSRGCRGHLLLAWYWDALCCLETPPILPFCVSGLRTGDPFSKGRKRFKVSQGNSSLLFHTLT